MDMIPSALLDREESLVEFLTHRGTAVSSGVMRINLLLLALG
jgi:hypothetical protein